MTKRIKPAARANAADERAKVNGRRVRRDLTEKKILKAVARLLVKRGVDGLGMNVVAKAAGVDKVLIYRYFGDLGGLLRRYGESVDFWPTFDEVLGPERDVLREPDAGRIASRILVNYARALRRRPTTLELLAWECSHRNELTMVLEETRERWSGALLAEIKKSGVELAQPLVALAIVMSAAIHYLAVRGRHIDVFSGLEIGSDRGWREIESVIAEAFCPRR